MPRARGPKFISVRRLRLGSLIQGPLDLLFKKKKLNLQTLSAAALLYLDPIVSPWPPPFPLHLDPAAHKSFLYPTPPCQPQMPPVADAPPPSSRLTLSPLPSCSSCSQIQPRGGYGKIGPLTIKILVFFFVRLDLANN